MEGRINAAARAMRYGTPVDARDVAFAQKASGLLVRLHENQCAAGKLHSKYTYTVPNTNGMQSRLHATPLDDVRADCLHRENKDLWVKLRAVFNGGPVDLAMLDSTRRCRLVLESDLEGYLATQPRSLDEKWRDDFADATRAYVVGGNNDLTPFRDLRARVATDISPDRAAKMVDGIDKILATP